MSRYKDITLGADIRDGVGSDRFAKLANIASLYNGAIGDNAKADYLGQLRGEAHRIADTQASEFRHAGLTTDQLADAVGTIRGTAMRVVALCDAAVA